MGDLGLQSGDLVVLRDVDLDGLGFQGGDLLVYPGMELGTLGLQPGDLLILHRDSIIPFLKMDAHRVGLPAFLSPDARDLLVAIQVMQARARVEEVVLAC